MSSLIIFLALIQVKHLFCDFVYQPPVMWMNKGNLRHYGGYLHSGFHSLVTLAILLLFTTNWSLIAALITFEFVAHYVIDYSKMNINAKFKYKCDKHNEFWLLLGLDQYLHQMTYIIIAIAMFM